MQRLLIYCEILDKWEDERRPQRKPSKRRGVSKSYVKYELFHNGNNMTRRPTVPKVFKCPFCNQDESVEAVMDFKTKIGDLKCRMCGANFQTTISCKFYKDSK